MRGIAIRLALASTVAGLTLSSWAQTTSPQLSVKGKPASTGSARRTRALTPGQKFVMDTVAMAVALPQSDPQDRLRVLAGAINAIAAIRPATAKKLSREGLKIESELIQSGQQPVVSLLASGPVDCAAAQEFVENLSPLTVRVAEQSLIGALTSCARQTLDPASRKLDAAIEKKVAAPRALMAAMEVYGNTSAWSREHFEKAFSSLPDPTDKNSVTVAQDYTVLYISWADTVEKSMARTAGLELLGWLAKMDDTPQRANAVNAADGAMRHTLGAAGYKDALENDAVAATLVRSASQVANIPPAPRSTVSVLAAMDENGTDQSDRLRNLPAPQRAQEAAAHGFASARAGNKQQAALYFDMAFSALDDAWEGRDSGNNAADLVQEVSEAAAQAGSVDALERAQKLRDSSAQAIAMLAVAGVVARGGRVR